MSTQIPSGSERHQGRILVVDDEEPNRTLLRELLEQEGYKVQEAANGEDALRQVAEDPPDVVLLDVMMPVLDGFEVCRRIKETTASIHIPVLLVTALRERRDRLTGIRAGASDFLTKPIDMQEVVLRVRNAVFTKHLFDENLSYQRELEHKVEEKTRDLQRAHSQLERRVKELDGRDRLMLLQMSGAGLQEAYEVIMGVLAQALNIQWATLYRPSARGDRLEAVAALGLSVPGKVESQERLAEVPAVPVDDEQHLAARAFHLAKLYQGRGHEAAIPVLYRDQAMGALWVDGLDGGESGQDYLNTLWRLGQAVALVLRMAQATEDLTEGRVEIEELLRMKE
ncbi:MAG: response regulator [Candidatus Latescibacteria bacterium]|nr:response regulator [Candidatus Latescibacterota bacterium]